MLYDELALDTVGDRKSALFLIMSDTDLTFNFLISMIYTQLFNLLCEKADDVYGGRLPVADFLPSDSDLEAVRPAAVMRKIYAKKTVRHKTARFEREKIKISVFSLRLMYSRWEA